MDFESFFNKILIFYKVKTVTDLADKLNVTRSTVSGWKNRQATGTILEFLFNNDLETLHYIFSSDKNTQNIKNISGGQNANNVQGNQIQGEETNKNEYIIPETTMDDLNTLFKIAIENEKENNLIEIIDDFIHTTKKELRKK